MPEYTRASRSDQLQAIRTLVMEVLTYLWIRRFKTQFTHIYYASYPTCLDKLGLFHHVLYEGCQHCRECQDYRNSHSFKTQKNTQSHSSSSIAWTHVIFFVWSNFTDRFLSRSLYGSCYPKRTTPWQTDVSCYFWSWQHMKLLNAYHIDGFIKETGRRATMEDKLCHRLFFSLASWPESVPTGFGASLRAVIYITFLL